MSRITETIDRISDDVLIYIIQHSNGFSWNFLAIKIMLTRLNLKITMSKDKDAILHECCNELRRLLKNSSNIPSSQADLKQILSLSI